MARYKRSNASAPCGRTHLQGNNRWIGRNKNRRTIEMESSASSSRKKVQHQRSQAHLITLTASALCLVTLVLFSCSFQYVGGHEIASNLGIMDSHQRDVNVFLPHQRNRRENGMPTNSGPSWDHLVGTNAEEAKTKILEEHPHLQVVVVPHNAFMTMDYNTQRVRIFKDENQNVVKAPKLG